MKIKNLAFYGVMAAILGSVGTARADDSTIIASKGYVDAYAQKQSDRVKATWAASTADHTSTDKYPSMKTLNDAITTVTANQAQSDWNETTTTSPAYIKNKPTIPVVDQTYNAASTNAQSGTAVAGAIAGKEDVANKQAAQTDTVTRWSLTAAEGSAGYASDTKYPTVKAVAQQIADINVSAAVDNGTGSNTALELTSSATKAPSTRSVIAMAENNPFITKNASGVTTVAGGVATKFATTKAIGDSLKNLDGLGADGSSGLSAGDMTNNQSRLKRPVVKVTQTDGQVTAELGQIGSGGIEANAITPSHVTFIATQGDYQKGWGDASVTAANDQANNSKLGTGKANKDTYVPTMLAVEKYVGENAIAPNANITASTDHSIVTYDAHGLVTGGIALPTLNDINNATTDAACTKGAPCVLSYYVDGSNKYYKWTNMDTEGLNAVNDSNS